MKHLTLTKQKQLLKHFSRHNEHKQGEHIADRDLWMKYYHYVPELKCVLSSDGANMFVSYELYEGTEAGKTFNFYENLSTRDDNEHKLPNYVLGILKDALNTRKKGWWKGYFYLPKGSVPTKKSDIANTYIKMPIGNQTHIIPTRKKKPIEGITFKMRLRLGYALLSTDFEKCFLLTSVMQGIQHVKEPTYVYSAHDGKVII